MKTTVLLLGAVVAVLAISSFAAPTLLTPRAASSAFSRVAGENNDVNQLASDSTVVLTPRAQSSQIKVVKGIADEPNPALACKNTMGGSPKAVAECSSHTTMPGCPPVASLK